MALIPDFGKNGGEETSIKAENEQNEQFFPKV